MLVWPPKDPDEEISYAIDWSLRLGSDAINTASFAVSSGDVTVSDSEYDGAFSQVNVSGGTAGTKAKVLCSITTEDGQTLQQTATILIRAR
jgi:hypothetical protein